VKGQSQALTNIEISWTGDSWTAKWIWTKYKCLLWLREEEIMSSRSRSRRSRSYAILVSTMWRRGSSFKTKTYLLYFDTYKIQTL